jgi:hypothetical protein
MERKKKVRDTIKYQTGKFLELVAVKYGNPDDYPSWTAYERESISLHCQLPWDLDFIKCKHCSYVLVFSIKNRLDGNDWYGQTTQYNATKGMKLHNRKHKLPDGN